MQMVPTKNIPIEKMNRQKHFTFAGSFFRSIRFCLAEEQFLYIFHRHILTCVQFKCCNTLP